jgi:hypothetical protein
VQHHSDYVTCLAASEAAGKLVSAGLRSEVITYDMQVGANTCAGVRCEQQHERFTVAVKAAAACVAAAAAAGKLVSAGLRSEVITYDMQVGGRQHMHMQSGVPGVAVSNGMRTLKQWWQQLQHVWWQHVWLQQLQQQASGWQAGVSGAAQGSHHICLHSLLLLLLLLVMSADAAGAPSNALPKQQRQQQRSEQHH